MKRVLQIGMHNELGGVETFLMNYYMHLDKTKIQYDFINMYEEDLCFSKEIREMGGKIYKVKNVKKHPIKYFNQIKKIIKENEYDTVHINILSAANILPILAADCANAKNIIVHSHNGNVPKSVVKKILNNVNRKIMIKRATTLLACSEKAGKWLFGDKSKFIIIQNAIDMSKFKFDVEKRKNIRQQYGLENKLVIGHVGRFAEEKNHKFLLEIFAKIKKKRPEAKLLLIGKGNLKDQIKEKVLKMGLKNDVIFEESSHDKIGDFYQVMDVFVLPSLFEGLPLVLIEAQSNGLKCFASEEAVSIEANISGNLQYIKLDNNPDEWCEKILNIKTERRENDLKYLDRKYDIKEAVKKLEDLYLNLVD